MDTPRGRALPCRDRFAAAGGATLLEHDGHGHRGHERDSVEHVVEPQHAGNELQTLDASGKHVDGEQRAPDVRTTRCELGGAEEDRSERVVKLPKVARARA